MTAALAKWVQPVLYQQPVRTPKSAHIPSHPPSQKTRQSMPKTPSTQSSEKIKSETVASLQPSEGKDAVAAVFHRSARGYQLAWNQSRAAKGNTDPGVFFLCGFHSDMQGIKAQHLAEYCEERGMAFTRFDYFGHGTSEGKAEDGTIGQWLADALEIFDLTQGPQIVVGSSMGGWLSMLLTLARPERVVGLVGIAAAPDFTEALLWDRLTDKQQKTMVRTGWLDVPSTYGDPYRITIRFMEESTEHFLLDKPSIPIHCPVTLVHGINDTEVPFEFSMALNEKLESKNVRTMLIPDGDHRLSSPKGLRAVTNAVEKMRAGLAEPLA